MLAPAVNNSARAEMAAVKAAWNQLAGGCTYGGAGNAYTITSDAPGVISTSYAAGMIFMLKANATNSGAATLNVDGVGAVSITTNDGGALIAGDIVSGGLYLCAYNATGPRFELVGSIAGGAYQPLDATLTAVAALVGASGQVMRWTGTDTFTLDDTTAFGRSLWNAADAAAGRTLLGVSTSGATLQVANNLSDVASVPTARTNLGLTALATTTPAAGIATFLATPTSANLVAAVTDETGSGALVFASSPSLSTPTLATPILTGTPAFTGSAGTNRQTLHQTAGVNRWAVGMDSADNYIIARSNSSGVFQEICLTIDQGTGVPDFSDTPTVAGVSVATRTATETLTNKTLTSPTINGVTLSGTVAGAASWSNVQTYSANIVLNNGSYVRFGVAGATGDFYWGKPNGTDLYLYNNATGVLSVIGTQMDFVLKPTVLGVAVPTISSTDTLTNKTLSSPTLSGTIAGSPTASGNWTFTARPIITNASPEIDFRETGAAADEGNWREAIDAGVRALYMVNDAINDFYPVWAIDRTGYTTCTYNFGSGVTLQRNGVAIPTISSTDTLTNKTLSSPTISGTISGTPSWVSAQTFPTSCVFGAGGTGTNGGNLFLNAGTGVGVGAVLLGQANGTNKWAIGSYSGIHAGAHDDDVVVYSVADKFYMTRAAVKYEIADTANTITFTNKTLSSPTLSGTVALSGTPDITGAARTTGLWNFTQGEVRNSNTSAYFSFWNGASTVRSGFIQLTTSGVGTISNEISAGTWNLTTTGGGTVQVNGAVIADASNTLTLTNKTLTSPTINGGTIQSRIQISSETTGSLTSVSANKIIQCTGGVTMANAVFTAGDMLVLDPGTAARTITRGASVTMYLNGVDSATATLAANQMGGVHWRSSSVCILTGAVS